LAFYASTGFSSEDDQCGDFVTFASTDPICGLDQVPQLRLGIVGRDPSRAVAQQILTVLETIPLGMVSGCTGTSMCVY